MIRAQCLGLGAFLIIAGGGDYGAAQILRNPDSHRANAGTGSMDQNGLARFQLGIVEQHVFDGGEGDRPASGIFEGKPIRHAHQKPRILVHQLLREAIQMETLHAANIFTKIIAPFATRLADAASRRAIRRDMIANLPVGHARPNRDNLADRFRAHRQWQIALGKGHAAKAPDINMVQRDSANAKLHFMRGRWRRWRHGFQAQIPITMQAKGAHHGAALSSRQTFCPPKPKEFDSTWRKPETLRASFATTSSPSVGSGSI